MKKKNPVICRYFVTGLLVAVFFVSAFACSCGIDPESSVPEDSLVESAHYADQSYIADCSPHIEFILSSNFSITNDNLYNYVAVFDRYEQPVVLGVERENGKYRIYTSSVGYAPGETYTIGLNGGVYFYG
ncbi:MAG: hypothetical protein LBS99_00225, partial [Clostridiales bacterium]|nr:hypothetical protein [Clostridiales bacterium]